MSLKRVITLMNISLLIFLIGGVSIVAAGEGEFFPGAGNSADFLSPSWKPALYGTIISEDPDFLLPSWKPALYGTIISEDPDFLLPTWQPVKYTTPYSDPDFLNKNWSVHTPTLLRYNQIDKSSINSNQLNPFASYTELQEQGWNFGKDLVFW